MSLTIIKTEPAFTVTECGIEENVETTEYNVHTCEEVDAYATKVNRKLADQEARITLLQKRIIDLYWLIVLMFVFELLSRTLS